MTQWKSYEFFSPIAHLASFSVACGASSCLEIIVFVCTVCSPMQITFYGVLFNCKEGGRMLRWYFCRSRSYRCWMHRTMPKSFHGWSSCNNLPCSKQSYRTPHFWAAHQDLEGCNALHSSGPLAYHYWRGVLGRRACDVLKLHSWIMGNVHAFVHQACQ